MSYLELTLVTFDSYLQIAKQCVFMQDLSLLTAALCTVLSSLLTTVSELFKYPYNKLERTDDVTLHD